MYVCVCVLCAEKTRNKTNFSIEMKISAIQFNIHYKMFAFVVIKSIKEALKKKSYRDSGSGGDGDSGNGIRMNGFS